MLFVLPPLVCNAVFNCSGFAEMCRSSLRRGFCRRALMHWRHQLDAKELAVSKLRLKHLTKYMRQEAEGRHYRVLMFVLSKWILMVQSEQPRSKDTALRIQKLEQVSGSRHCPCVSSDFFQSRHPYRLCLHHPVLRVF